MSGILSPSSAETGAIGWGTAACSFGSSFGASATISAFGGAAQEAKPMANRRKIGFFTEDFYRDSMGGTGLRVFGPV